MIHVRACAHAQRVLIECSYLKSMSSYNVNDSIVAMCYARVRTATVQRSAALGLATVVSICKKVALVVTPVLRLPCAATPRPQSSL